ncbi:hypothetical protein [Cysteiniphilum marinum]|uniref:hypothetical protein n=1 Tax=Cysteiniphilum marinum TaxID=2774191 RepID=UPI00193B7D19|nr:hypothetical protein [Cysteiniphilum marinum]
MQIKINLIRQLGRKTAINGSTLMLPIEQPDFDLYVDYPICDKQQNYCVSALFFHYSNDEYCSVYFYTKNDKDAELINQKISEAISSNERHVLLSNVEIIEVENFNEKLPEKHVVNHLNIVKGKVLKSINPFEKLANSSIA